MPKQDLKNLFSDKKSFPDTMEITLGNGATVTLADLRAYNDSVGGELQASYESKAANLNKEFQKVNAASERLAFIISEMQQGRLPEDAEALGFKLPAPPTDKRTTRGKGEEFADYESDPYMKPLLNTVNELKTALSERDKKIESLTKNMSQASLTFINRELQREYEALPMKDLGDKVGDDLSLQNLTKYAVENNMLTRDKLPNIRRAFDDIAGPKLTEKRMKEAEERGYKKRDAELADSMLPFPGAGSGRHALTEPKGPKPVETKGKRAEQILSESLSNAMKDSDMWKSIAGMPAEA